MRRLAAALVALPLAFAVGPTFAEEGPPTFSLNAIAAGALSRTNLGFGMLEGRATFSNHLYIAAGPSVLFLEDGDREYQARVWATLLARLGPLQLDDRNLWVFSDAGTTRYRNRLRLTMPLPMNRNTLRLQLFDEAYYEQGGRGWFRNVVSAGVGLDAGRAISVDAYWMLLDDDNRRQASMFQLILTIHLR